MLFVRLNLSSGKFVFPIPLADGRDLGLTESSFEKEFNCEEISEL